MSKKASDLPETKTPETKAEKFRRLALARLPKAVSAIKQLRRLANQSQYEYTTEQADKLVAYILNEVALLESSFNSKKVTEKPQFDI